MLRLKVIKSDPWHAGWVLFLQAQLQCQSKSPASHPEVQKGLLMSANVCSYVHAAQKTRWDERCDFTAELQIVFNEQHVTQHPFAIKMHSVWSFISLTQRSLAQHYTPLWVYTRAWIFLPVNVRVHDCLSLCDPVVDWQPVQDVSSLSPDDSWDRLQPLCDPEQDEKWVENEWMDFTARPWQVDRHSRVSRVLRCPQQIYDCRLWS